MYIAADGFQHLSSRKLSTQWGDLVQNDKSRAYITYGNEKTKICLDDMYLYKHIILVITLI